jgi:hypothetical protein
LRKVTAQRLLREAVHADGGPLIHNGLEEEQHSLDATYGFRTFRILELALYHSLGKLPEPELTHEFF